MTQTIEALWNGNIDPVGHCGSQDPLVRELVSLIERNRESLSKGLTEAQMETFQKYMELAFCDGFCLGGKLAVEMLR